MDRSETIFIRTVAKVWRGPAINFRRASATLTVLLSSFLQIPNFSLNIRGVQFLVCVLTTHIIVLSGYNRLSMHDCIQNRISKLVLVILTLCTQLFAAHQYQMLSLSKCTEFILLCAKHKCAFPLGPTKFNLCFPSSNMLSPWLVLFCHHLKTSEPPKVFEVDWCYLHFILELLNRQPALCLWSVDLDSSQNKSPA